MTAPVFSLPTLMAVSLDRLSVQPLWPRDLALLPGAAAGLQLLPALHLTLGLLLGGWTLLFLFRIVLTWYPQVDLRQGAMRLIGLPTEALLTLTRRLIPPIGGVDVTPVVWVGLISLIRELLVGQQGLVTLAMLRSQGLA